MIDAVQCLQSLLLVSLSCSALEVNLVKTKLQPKRTWFLFFIPLLSSCVPLDTSEVREFGSTPQQRQVF